MMINACFVSVGALNDKNSAPFCFFKEFKELYVLYMYVYMYVKRVLYVLCKGITCI